MFFAVKPEKARSKSDREDVAKKYTAGESVLPKITTRERTEDEKRAEEEDRRLVQEVREISLREAEAAASDSSPGGRNRSSDSRRRDQGSSRPRTASDRSPRPPGAPASRQNSDHLQVDSRGHRRQRSDSRPRQVEHQSSIRSLIGAAELSERDISREIEEFARQIQEEGLLDGLDLDNIDLSRDDDLSRRITEAYRRRQRERQSNTQSRSPAAQSRQRDGSQSDARLRVGETNGRPSRGRSSTDERPVSGGSQVQDTASPQPSATPTTPAAASTSAPVIPDIPNRSGRRRTNSGLSSPASPPQVYPSQRPAGRSQTDLTLRVAALEVGRQHERSSSVPSSPQDASSANVSFANRVAQSNAAISPETLNPTPPRAAKPSELAVVHSAGVSPLPSPTRAGPSKGPSELFPEPLINCANCGKEHIEYEVHYNCDQCSNGEWNLCLDCYRRGKGCQYWFGFGQAATRKWDKIREQRGDDVLPPPHVLVPHRYIPPTSTPGGADGRKAVSNDDPSHRLETGTFCANCFAWTNDCYWRCDICNEGEWGFCNNCVNQGKSCAHMLLPLAFEVTEPHRESLGRPASATLAPGVDSSNSFKPLLFNSTCDLCHEGISPAEVRFHCYSCTSSLVADASQGDYDICSQCYAGLVARGNLSAENGYSGWRRCLQGHRMAVIGFVDSDEGRWRFIDKDMVGGHALRVESVEGSEEETQGLQKWTWKQDTERLERLAASDVSATAPTYFGGGTFSEDFPPDGGSGSMGRSKWAWYPQEGARDELLFPRGAQVREIVDVNGDWFFGTYMGAKGLFPAPYVHLETTWI